MMIRQLNRLRRSCRNWKDSATSTAADCDEATAGRVFSRDDPLLMLSVYTRTRNTTLFTTLYTCTHTHPFNDPFPGLPGRAGTRKVKPIWILLKQETVSGSSISWAICKSAPHSRQITTPAPHHSVFYRPDALPAAQPTASKR